MGFGKFVTGQVLKRGTKGKLGPQGRLQALLRLPTLLKLGYALLRDDRVPMWLRVSTLGALGLIFSPIDIPTVIPILGQFWDFTLAVTVLELFIKWAPADVVNEHIRKMRLEGKIPLR